MNRLQHETSPYLLQHAQNPVDWYAWKPEAFERAKKEDKLILVSIGYSTCHWCHVMEKESFEDEAIADFMNTHFISIKVDREERPDVDQIYMEACQIMTGSGGWPLNCFLLPDGRPFYAGTYYPPKPKYNRPSWTQVLENLANAYQQKREVVESQANQLTDLIRNSANNFIRQNLVSAITSPFNLEGLHNIFGKIEQRFDPIYGGFGSAPKFPGTMTLEWLSSYAYFTGNIKAENHISLSLEKMIQGGIYDQLGGGFARYSTDKAWLVPHFEKMLYDNAQLIGLISDQYKRTKKPLYKETIIDTLDFIAREMTSPEGGFYSALDADSEGEEGKFYVWKKQEINEILGEEAQLFCAFYDVTETGNWEHQNILWRKQSYETFARENGLEVEELKSQLKRMREKIFQYRTKRIRPGLDDKILLNWNALQCTAYTKAYTALGDTAYLKTAEKNMAFLQDRFAQPEAPALYHTYKDGKTQYHAFLDDYAYVIEALLELYAVSFQEKYLEKALTFTDFVLEQFLDSTNNLFYFIPKTQDDVLLRRKELFDSAVPSGNATMIQNLLHLGIILDRPDFKEQANLMLQRLKDTIEKHPSSFAKWANGYLKMIFPTREIAIVGPEAMGIGKIINALFVPNKVLMASLDGSNSTYPLLAGKSTKGDTNIYVCQNYSCQLPVKEIEAFIEIITPLKEKRPDETADLAS